MSPSVRAAVAAFDAVAMAVFAYLKTGGFGNPGVDLMLWGSAVAAAVAAFVVATNGPSIMGWIAIGYILFAGLLLTDVPQIVLVALAVALMPVVQRPRNSLAFGLVVATLSAFVWRVIIVLWLRAAA